MMLNIGIQKPEFRTFCQPDFLTTYIKISQNNCHCERSVAISFAKFYKKIVPMIDIVFWSGGKDSYLALQFFLRKYDTEKLKLLTTYEDERNVVPHQNLSLSTIQNQAKSLGLELITVPLPEECPNKIYLEKLESVLNDEGDFRYLIFGDWHLEDIKAWREKVFEEMGFQCLYPIWKKPLDELLPELLLKPVEIRISAVSKEYQRYLRKGELYNQQLIRQLPEEIDPMGENGEFHTEVIFKEFPKPNNY